MDSSLSNKSRFYLICVVCTAVFSLYYLLLTQNGMGATEDSLQYEYAARSFSQTQTLKTKGDLPYVQWGPLYPIILSFNAAQPRLLARWLHLGSMLCCIVVWLLLFYKTTANHWLCLWYGLALVWSTELMTLAVFMWSEAIFMALFAMFCFTLHQSLLGKGSYLWGIIWAILMLMQRNAGVFLFVGIILGAAMVIKNSKIKLHQLIRIGVLGSVGFMGWNVFTMLIQGNHPTQFDYPEGFSLLGNANRLLLSITNWVMPVLSEQRVEAGLVLLLLLLLWYFLRKKNKQAPWLVVCWMGMIGYLSVWLVVYASQADIQRFTAVVYPLFFFLFGVGIQEVGLRFPAYRKTIVALSFIWLIYPMIRLGYHLYNHL